MVIGESKPTHNIHLDSNLQSESRQPGRDFGSVGPIELSVMMELSDNLHHLIQLSSHTCGY